MIFACSSAKAEIVNVRKQHAADLDRPVSTAVEGFASLVPDDGGSFFGIVGQSDIRGGRHQGSRRRGVLTLAIDAGELA